MTEKNGFSVVAATRVTHRFSTPGSSASCWALLKRCTSSTNSTVSRPVATSSARAASIAARTSLTPAETALTSTKRRSVCPLTIEAIVVLPVPGGPHSSSDSERPSSISWRSGEPGSRSCGCPTSSSRVRGRIRTASGAAAWAAEDSEPPVAVVRDGVPATSNNPSTRPTLCARRVGARARPQTAESALVHAVRRARAPTRRGQAETMVREPMSNQRSW